MTVALAAAGLASVASFLFASWILLVLFVLFSRVQSAPEQKQLRLASSAAPYADLDNTEADAEAESTARSSRQR